MDATLAPTDVGNLGVLLLTETHLYSLTMATVIPEHAEQTLLSGYPLVPNLAHLHLHLGHLADAFIQSDFVGHS